MLDKPCFKAWLLYLKSGLCDNSTHESPRICCSHVGKVFGGNGRHSMPNSANNLRLRAEDRNMSRRRIIHPAYQMSQCSRTLIAPSDSLW